MREARGECVTPAKAGIQESGVLDSGFRRNDEGRASSQD